MYSNTKKTEVKRMSMNYGYSPNSIQDLAYENNSTVDDPLPINVAQFRRFGPGFRRPFFGRPFPFRRFGPPSFVEPFLYAAPYPYYPCSPYDPYCPYYY